MRVLFVIRGNDSYSSQQAQIELIDGLSKKNIEVFLIGEVSKEVEFEIKKKEISFYSLYPKKRIDKLYSSKLVEYINANSINIVYFLDGKALRSGLISLKNHPVKIVVYYGSVSLHWYDPSSYLTYLNSRVDKIVCNSNYVFEHVKKQLSSSNKHKAVRIFKGYSSHWFNHIKAKNLSKFNIPESAIVVAFVGNHRKVKGTKYFLKSFQYIKSQKEVHYLVIGNRTDSIELRKIISAGPISNRIHFLGKRNDAVSLIKSCDIYTQTSLSEGFGRAISEALSVGKPVVMTNAGGCTELIDSSSGIVVPKKDPKAIAKAISDLADNDKMRIDMGKNSVKRIDEVYSIQKTIDQTLLLYKDLLS